MKDFVGRVVRNCYNGLVPPFGLAERALNFRSVRMVAPRSDDRPDRLPPSEQRVFPRRPVEGAITFRLADEPQARPVPGKLVDISEGGIGFITERAPAVGSRIALEWRGADGAGTRLTMIAVVYWFQTDEKAGVERVGCAFERHLTDAEMERF